MDFIVCASARPPPACWGLLSPWTSDLGFLTELVDIFDELSLLTELSPIFDDLGILTELGAIFDELFALVCAASRSWAPSSAS